jgi:hypothetical protein
MPNPPKRTVQWWVSKMTLHSGVDRDVFALVQLRFIEYTMTTLAVKKYWEGLRREPVCQCELEGSRSARPACMRCCYLTTTHGELDRAHGQITRGFSQDQAHVPSRRDLRDHRGRKDFQCKYEPEEEQTRGRSREKLARTTRRTTRTAARTMTTRRRESRRRKAMGLQGWIMQHIGALARGSAARLSTRGRSARRWW